MLTNKESLLRIFARHQFADIRSAFIDAARSNSERRTKVFDSLINSGFEECSVPAENQLTEDGRAVIAILGKTYAMRQDEYLRRKKELEEKFISESQIKSVSGTEELESLTCPRCKEELQRSGVCPSCVLGQAGYKYRYVCACGVEFPTKERL